MVLTINNNIINKPSSTDSGWSSYSVYSQESYTGSAYIKFKVLNLNSIFMVGLSSSPTNTLSYVNTEFQIYIRDNTSSSDNNSSLVFHKGTQIGDWGTIVNLNDIFEILYDGKIINYFHNGESFYNFSGINVSNNDNFHLKISTAGTHTGSFVEILEFASAPSNYIITNSLETINTSNNSFTFNGNSDYLEIPRHIAPQLANSDFTIKFWAKFNSNDIGSGPVVYAQGSRENSDFSSGENRQLLVYFIKRDTPEYQIKVSFLEQYAYTIITESNILNWTHYAFVYKTNQNTNNDAVSLYINGVKGTLTIHAHGSNSGGSWLNPTKASGPVFIGRLMNTVDNLNHDYFNSKLKHLRVYNSIKYTSNFSVNSTNHTIISNPYLPINLDLLLYIPMINKDKIVYHNNNNLLSNNNRLYCYQNELYFENGKIITENSQTTSIRFKNNYVGINT